MTEYKDVFFDGYDEIIKVKLSNKENLVFYSEDGIKLIHSTEYITRRIEGVENCLEYLKRILTEEYIYKIEQVILKSV
ncbi:MAG: hypothetical protein K9H48_07635 [Melioribacteraceae bacterium]|nr:hypothetical protein [Melioribacteraceae bacterium]